MYKSLHFARRFSIQNIDEHAIREYTAGSAVTVHGVDTDVPAGMISPRAAEFAVSTGYAFPLELADNGRPFLDSGRAPSLSASPAAQASQPTTPPVASPPATPAATVAPATGRRGRPAKSG